MKSGTVSTSIKNKVGTITFSHPKGNSLPGNLLSELTKAIKAFGQDENIRVLLLTSEGDKAFCAGASFDEFLAATNSSDSKEFFMGFANLIQAIRTCPKFVVTRVQGKVVGGGVGIVAASDYVIATESASLRLSELALGIGPFVVGPSIIRKIGAGAFSAMAIDTEWRDASWAKTNGLYANVVTSISELDNEIEKLVSRLSESHSAAMQHLKEIFWEGVEPWQALLEKRSQITGSLVMTSFVKEKIASIQNK